MHYILEKRQKHKKFYHFDRSRLDSGSTIVRPCVIMLVSFCDTIFGRISSTLCSSSGGISYDRSEITSHLTPPPPLYFWIHIGMRWWSERETFGPPTKPPKKGGMFRVFSSQNKHYFAVRRITHHSLHSTSSFKWPSSILIVLCNNCRGLLALDVVISTSLMSNSIFQNMLIELW